MPSLAVIPFNADEAKEHQNAWAKHLGVDPEITNSIGMKLRLIPPGGFKMGPDYVVRLTRPYRLGIHEVTVGQFRAFVKETGHKTEAETNGKGGFAIGAGGLEDPLPSYNWKNADFSPAEDHPVVFVSWEDAAKFCDWLSSKERKNYRLPTEAEWEWACRAGSKGKYHFGDNPNDLDAYAWHLGNSGRKSHPVGRKKPNAWGLFDMHGNAAEFCYDWLGLYPSGTRVDPFGAATGTVRVLRSSASNDTAEATAASQRNNAAPTFVNHNFGFRVLLQPEVGLPALAAVPWVPLFDGKDLKAWEVAADFPGAWTLEGNILTGKIDVKAGKSRSLLLSKRKDFHNFHARVEMKVKNGRGGLMFSGQAPLFKTNLAFVNIDPRFNAAGWQIDANGALSTGGGPRVATLQPDTWFTLDVIAHRSEATYFINGEKIGHFDNILVQPGHLALDVIYGDAVLSVRKVEIKELPADRTPPPIIGDLKPKTLLAQPSVRLFNGKDLKGWTGDIKDWKIEKETLVSGGKPALLRTEEYFQDFALRFEAFLEPADGPAPFFEVYVHGRDDESDKATQQGLIKIIPVGQGFPEGSGSYSVLNYDRSQVVKSLATFKLDSFRPLQWNPMEIRSLNGQVEIFANGRAIHRFDVPRGKAGYIGLKAHSAGEWRFGSIEIKSLPTTKVP